MLHPPLLPGLQAEIVETPRLKTFIITHGSPDGVPVIFVDGNISSARFWEELLVEMPPQYRCIAVDLRGYGHSETKPIDATRGVRDWSDDILALLDTLAIDRAHFVGWSMGGGIVMQLAIDQPSRVLSLTLEAPMSPYGFGGTKGLVSRLNFEDAAGSGAGGVNPEYLRRLAAGDTSADDPNSPRNVMNNFYFKPPFKSEREDILVAETLLTATGEGNYPGDFTTSPNWPGLAPGVTGVNNAMSPKYCHLSGFATITPRPPVLWIRGVDDQIVSDTSFFDLATLGQLGFVPGWPGAEVCPPQPMVGQMRAVLDAYAAQGGVYTEHALPDCGHSPHIEKPADFRSLLLPFLAGV